MLTSAPCGLSGELGLNALKLVEEASEGNIGNVWITKEVWLSLQTVQGQIITPKPAILKTVHSGRTGPSGPSVQLRVEGAQGVALENAPFLRLQIAETLIVSSVLGTQLRLKSVMLMFALCGLNGVSGPNALLLAVEVNREG